MARASNLTFNGGIARMQRTVDRYGLAVRLGIAADGEELAGHARAELPARAKWNDRTGEARRGLWANFRSNGLVHVIEMGYSVHYGVFLETMHAGDLAVVRPVSRDVATEWMLRARERMGRVPG